MYQCEYFAIHELVSRQMYELRGEKAWELLDDRGLITLDQLRRRYGSMTVNNWFWHGDREWSGLRTFESPYYSMTSQHSFGRAFDIVFQHTAAAKVREDILRNPDEPCFRFINSVELGVSWLHFDVRNCHRLKTYYP